MKTYLIFTDNGETKSVALSKMDSSRFDAFVKLSRFQTGNIQVYQIQDGLEDAHIDCLLDDCFKSLQTFTDSEEPVLSK